MSTVCGHDPQACLSIRENAMVNPPLAESERMESHARDHS